MQDIKDNRRAGVKSTTLLFGNNTKLILTGFAVTMTSGIITTGMLIGQTWPYYAAATLTNLHLARQVARLCDQTPPLMCSVYFIDRDSQAGHSIRLFGQVQGKQMVGFNHFSRNYTRESVEIKP